VTFVVGVLQRVEGTSSARAGAGEVQVAALQQLVGDLAGDRESVRRRRPGRAKQRAVRMSRAYSAINAMWRFRAWPSGSAWMCANQTPA